MKALDVIIGLLLIIGGLNWGFIGLFNFNFVEAIFSQLPVAMKITYILVGVAAVVKIFRCKSMRQCCK